MKRVVIIFTFIVLIVFGGCSTKEVSNKSALFWYGKILEAVKTSDLANADSYFLSLRSEHRKSPFIKEAILILANAHLDYEEYKVANYYYDTYIKLYGQSDKKEFISYKKIQSNFYSFNRAFREQKLLIDTIATSNKFIVEFPDSKYLSEVKMIIAKMNLAQISLNDKVSILYTKLDKPKASEFYRQKNSNNSLSKTKYKEAPIPWYRWLFE
jgi:outer membrane protein assembly factor BamD